ncbi:MAG TPA: glycosyltransferase family 4 protein [Rhodothermales bacterium]|nr:glycosyltransferase family 4 protein [Rhodothermales bacterium]
MSVVEPHILLLELYAGGHRGQYIRQLVEYWTAHALPGRLTVAIPPEFFDIHADVQAVLEDAKRVEVVILNMPDRAAVAALSEWRKSRLYGRVLRTVVAQLRPDHCVLLYFDHAQLPLALDLRFAFPVTLSGVYFRPSFHYHRLGGGAPAWKERLRDWRKRILLWAALRNPHLTYIFSLDPYAVSDIQALRGGAQVVALPDGITPRPALLSPDAQRQQWGVADGRNVALMFGGINARKGIHEVLAALRLLPSDIQQACCLIVSGHIREAEKEKIKTGIQQVQEVTAVQIIVDDRFVEEEEIQGMVAAADLVLLTYQRHVGSSGVLVRAAHAGVPVLGSDYGLVGEHLRRRHLGWAVDAASPQAIAEGLRQALTDLSVLSFDEEEAGHFAEEHTASAFSATIFRHICEAAIN